MKKAHLLFLFTLLYISVLVSGCDYHPAYYDYLITLEGTEYYTGNGTTIFLVPLPVVNGTPVFTNEEAIAWTKKWKDLDWKPQIVNTEEGPMLSLSYDKKKLTMAGFDMRNNLTDHPFNDSEKSELLWNNSSLRYPFYPVIKQSINSTPSVAHIPGGVGYAYKYQTYVYIDENMVPIPGKNHTIKVYSVMVINEGSISNTGESHSAVIYEDIPEGVKGWVPVTVYA